MKRILLFLFCGILTGSLFAQDKVENISKTGWFLQGLVGINSTSTQEMGLGSNLGYSLSAEFGYLFNPYLSSDIQFQYDRPTLRNFYTSKKSKFNSMEPSLNVFWDLTNTFCGYIPGRMNHLRLYAGGAVGFTSGLPGGYTSAENTDNASVFGFRGGIQYERNIGNSWAFATDASINFFKYKYAGRESTNNSLDNHMNIKFGIRRYFGMGTIHKHRSDYRRVIYNTIVLRDTVVMKEVETVTASKEMYSIFFDIDKIDIHDSEMKKIESVAQALKANPKNIVFVFGYADKNTGTAKRNEWLAKNRAHVVAEQLVNKFGIESSRIITTNEGDKVQPFSQEEFEKNRSTICVITELKR